ncbi:sensor histidine kinase [Dermacoccaceae bacterium W4C1]
MNPPLFVRRDVEAAVLLFALAVLAAVVGLNDRVSFAGRDTSAWHLLPAAVVCLGITVQRRFRLPVMAVAAAVVLWDLAWGWSLGVFLAVWEVLFTAARHWPTPWAQRLRQAAIAIVVLAVVVVGIVAEDLRDAVNAGLLGGALLVAPVWWGFDVRREAELAALVKANAETARAQAVRDERLRMARELHDAVAGDLASIAIHAEAGLRSSAPESLDSPVHRSLAAIRGSSVRAVGELTRMIALLRREGEPDGDDAVSAPGLEQIPDLVEHAQRSGVDVQAVLPAAVPEVPAAIDHAGYRIVQEALTNAARHGARSVAVTVEVGEALSLEVTNVVVGEGDPSGTGLGLLTMRERAEGLGGDFEAGLVGPQDQRRWRVAASIPLVS